MPVFERFVFNRNYEGIMNVCSFKSVLEYALELGGEKKE